MTSSWQLRGLLLFALGTAATLTWWLQNREEAVAPLHAHAGKRTPDYSMETFTVTEILPSGEPNYRLRAKQLDHFADDGTAQLDQPRVEFYSADRVPWTLTADAGITSANNDDIQLTGAVVIERPATPDRAWLRLTTQNVRVRPRDEYAETDEHVTIQDPLSVTAAQGMRVFVNDERVLLQSKVQGKYESN